MQGLKSLAEELNIPVVVLSQLSRAPEHRKDHRPMITDFRDPAIEQTADAVIFLYRDEYYHEDTELKGIAEILVAKNSLGECGYRELMFIPDTVTFTNIVKK